MLGRDLRQLQELAKPIPNQAIEHDPQHPDDAHRPSVTPKRKVDSGTRIPVEKSPPHQ